MSSFGGGPSTPIEQVTELGDSILQKLVAAGITTVEALADMTPEQLEEIPGIGEKTLERISVAVRHYFGEYAEGEIRPEPSVAEQAPVAEATAEAEGAAVDAESATEATETEPPTDDSAGGTEAAEGTEAGEQPEAESTAEEAGEKEAGSGDA